MKKFDASFEYKVIYVFEIQDDEHKGLLKIGDATLKTDESIDLLKPNCRILNQAALERIKQYTNTAGIVPNLLHTELAIRTISKDGEYIIKAFRDHSVHRVLENSNIHKVQIKGSTGREWYRADLETAVRAIDAVKKGQNNLSNSNREVKVPIIFRPEQEEAIEKTIKQYKTGNKMLWNAKMRFGKTLSALEVVKKMKFKRTIIITHRPVVDKGWYDDFTKIFDEDDGYLYGSKNSGYSVEELEKSNNSYVYFSSIQDLRGSDIVGGKYDKNNLVFNLNWDFVIIDEAHEGTTTALGDEVIKNIVKEDDEYDTKFLALSGTPFNILRDYEESSIYTWDYIMEQSNKANWNMEHFGDSNPYEELPELKIYTYDLGKIIGQKRYEDIEDKAFNFREFFRTWTGNIKIDGKCMPEGANIGDFCHEEDVKSFLNLISKDDVDSNYPYSKKEYRDLFRHSLWMLPGVKEAKALSKLMKSHPIFGMGFEIVNVAGEGDDEVKSEDSLKMVQDAIRNSGNNGYTITLSCGKLTTGVTVPEWTAVLMLSGSFSTSAANYLQTIFRVQSPCNKDGMIKTSCYAFDFAPDRTLKMVAESVAISTKSGKTSGDDRKILGEFLNYCPVISIDGTIMKKYDTNKLLQQLKRAYAERAVQNGFDDASIYNDELLKLDGVALSEFATLKGIIGTSKASHKTNEIDINSQGLTNEEYEEIEKIENKKTKDRSIEERERLEELKEKGKNKRDAISILRGISIRMPLLIYGADVAIDEDVTIDKLTELVDDSSWEEFMPKGITKEYFKKFIKYYDPEVFVSAGRKIRNVVKSADELDPLERVKKISQLFSCFKNPDKETVLTPWRVVNMHMGACLGGYCFFDETYKTLIENPRYIEKEDVTKNVFRKDTKILEINSKTGLYPLYVAYTVYANKCAEYKEITLELKEKIWEDTIRNNIYVICKTPMAKSITKRTLTGFKSTYTNAHYFDDLVNMLENKPKQFLDRVEKPGYWKKEGEYRMRFDAVIGNPPYQEEGANNNKKEPIYPHFWDGAVQLSNTVSLIMPARFLFDAGQTSKTWNRKMLDDEHLKVIQYYNDSKDVFPSVDIKGGVAILLRNANKKFGAIGEYIPNDMLRSIASHFEKDIKNSLTSIMFGGRSDLKFNEEFLKTYPDSIEVRLKSIQKKHPNVKKLSPNEEYELKSSSLEVLGYVFKNEEPIIAVEYYKILGLIEGRREYRWIERKYMTPRYSENNIEKYKVFIPESNGAGAFGEILSTPVVAMPGESSTPTFISAGAFNSFEEADNLLKYIKTKFVRTLLGLCKKTQHNPIGTWSYIPLQDFTNNSDIDWICSIENIDKQLYKKYNLTDEEIKFIENQVKPM